MFRANKINVCVCAGEDPLSDSECDLDSVAGVLKLYFRGLEPPLFPYDSYPQLLDCVRKNHPNIITTVSMTTTNSAHLLSCFSISRHAGAEV